MMWPDTVGCGN